MLTPDASVSGSRKFVQLLAVLGLSPYLNRTCSLDYARSSFSLLSMFCVFKVNFLSDARTGNHPRYRIEAEQALAEAVGLGRAEDREKGAPQGLRSHRPPDTRSKLVANALIHQDFFVTSAEPMVEIFDDRIEITNSASLRERFGIAEKNASMASRFLNEAVEAGLIVVAAPEIGTRIRSYLPFRAFPGGGSSEVA